MDAMKKVLVCIMCMCSSFSFGQDVLQGYLLTQWHVENQKLDTLLNNFISKEWPCLTPENNTVLVMYFEGSVLSDTNAITLRVIHARDLDEQHFIGYLMKKNIRVFLHRSIADSDMFLRVSKNPKLTLVSQRITFGNYLIKNDDTLSLTGRWPYEAQWALLEHEGEIFKDPDFVIPCNIESAIQELNKLMNEEGWLLPSCK